MIHTERLILRPWRKADLSSLTALLGSAAVMRFSDAGPLGPDAQRAWLKTAMGLAHDTGLPGCWAVERQQSCSVIGYVSLSRNLGRVGRDTVELGFRFVEAAWGHGYATEACGAVIEAFPRDGRLSRVAAIVDPHNSASLRVIEKVGLKFEREIMFDGYAYPDHLYSKPLA